MVNSGRRRKAFRSIGFGAAELSLTSKSWAIAITAKITTVGAIWEFAEARRCSSRFRPDLGQRQSAETRQDCDYFSAPESAAHTTRSTWAGTVLAQTNCSL